MFEGCLGAGAGCVGVGCAGVVVVGGGCGVDGAAGGWLCPATRTVETAAPTINWLMAVVAKCFITSHLLSSSRSPATMHC
jgi:hypothetical protein